MGKPIIEINEISKCYRLGQFGFSSFREEVEKFTQRLRGKTVEKSTARDFWALRDVSFSVQPGEVVGIVGRNGAGKSTLLKLLSRITEPTSGEIVLRGRVASLLEVGTGFHPELSGRENVFLNGAILGMNKAEIARKFDEIVAFAEIDKFIDTPVKRYSSGMYVKLAFAVAAHLEPEILIVDEVLAVGDADFQRKCIEKMDQVSTESGRTVLFVSHNMGMVQALCRRGIMLAGGQVEFAGSVQDCVRHYLGNMDKNGGGRIDLPFESTRAGAGHARLTAIELLNAANAVTPVIDAGAPATVRLHCNHVLPGLRCLFTFYDVLGQPLATFNSNLGGDGDTRGSSGSVFSCHLPELLLVPGRYRLNVSLETNAGLEDHIEAGLIFDVVSASSRGRPVPANARHGALLLPHKWTSPL